MCPEKVDLDRLNPIIKRLFIPYKKEHLLPSIFSKPRISTFTFLTDSFFILVFLDLEGEKRARELVSKNQDPFPGLIKPENIEAPVAFGLNKSKNNFFQSNSVSNMYSFSLGNDCSFVLVEHKQSIKTEEDVKFDYTIDLAYVISFGDEINNNNFYEYLDELITVSLTNWGLING